MCADTSYMFVTGPEVVKKVTNAVVTAEEPRGRQRQPPIGWFARLYENEVECLCRCAVSTSCRKPPARRRARTGPRTTTWSERKKSSTVIPDIPTKPYGTSRELITSWSPRAISSKFQDAYAMATS